MKLIVLVFVAYAAAAERNKIYMRRAELQDQSNAASGYVYTADSSGPTSYTKLNGASRNGDNFGYHPITLGQYSVKDATPEVYKPVQYVVGHGYNFNDGDDDSHYVKEGGKAYDESSRSSNGEKTASGYKNVEEYGKGSSGKYSDEENKGFYGKNGGTKGSNYDLAERHAAKDEAYKGSKGGSFSKSDGHKKGSKTTGFHKVYHKDEYKKDHTFYDESDTKGHYDKYGNSNAYHSSENGGYRNGGKTTSVHDDSSYGKKGSHDKGHYVDDNNGYKDKSGQNKYYENESEYSNKGAQESGKSYGYSNGEEEKY